MTVAVDPGFFSIAHEGHAPSVPLPHQLGLKGHDPKGNDQTKATVRTAEQKTASTRVTNRDQGPTIIRPIEKTALTLASSPAGLTRALSAVELTTLREAPLVELPAQVLQALNLDARLLKALTTLTSRPTGSLVGSSGGTTAAATGTLTTGTLPVGSVSVGTTSPSGGTVSVGSVSVGSTVVAPLTTVVSTVVAPVTSLISTVVAPVITHDLDCCGPGRANHRTGYRPGGPDCYDDSRNSSSGNQRCLGFTDAIAFFDDSYRFCGPWLTSAKGRSYFGR